MPQKSTPDSYNIEYITSRITAPDYRHSYYYHNQQAIVEQ